MDFIHKATNSFIFWLKNYDHPKNLTDKQEQLLWLYHENGFKIINNYEDFCKMARELYYMGYETLPCASENKFKKVLDYSKGKIKIKSGYPIEIILFPIDTAYENFNYWMEGYNKEGYNHSENLTHTQLLLRWLTWNYGYVLISDYEDFCELVEKIDLEGYDIPKCPTEKEFNKALGKEYRKEDGDEALENFKFYVDFYHIPSEEVDIDILLLWIVVNNGLSIISTYEQFNKFIDLINTDGFNIIERISREEFEGNVKEQRAFLAQMGGYGEFKKPFVPTKKDTEEN